MAISFVCTCGARLTAKNELSGHRVKCPKCDKRVVLPNLEAAPPVEPKKAIGHRIGSELAGAVKAVALGASVAFGVVSALAAVVVVIGCLLVYSAYSAVRGYLASPAAARVVEAPVVLPAPVSAPAEVAEAPAPAPPPPAVAESPAIEPSPSGPPSGESPILSALSRMQSTPSPPPEPDSAPASFGGDSGTHVGPRGGVYHYSKNGNKVYRKR